MYKMQLFLHSAYRFVHRKPKNLKREAPGMGHVALLGDTFAMSGILWVDRKGVPLDALMTAYNAELWSQLHTWRCNAIALLLPFFFVSPGYYKLASFMVFVTPELSAGCISVQLYSTALHVSSCTQIVPTGHFIGRSQGCSLGRCDDRVQCCAMKPICIHGCICALQLRYLSQFIFCVSQLLWAGEFHGLCDPCMLHRKHLCTSLLAVSSCTQIVPTWFSCCVPFYRMCVYHFMIIHLPPHSVDSSHLDYLQLVSWWCSRGMSTSARLTALNLSYLFLSCTHLGFHCPLRKFVECICAHCLPHEQPCVVRSWACAHRFTCSIHGID
jgi:hypothetical protein